MALFDDILGGGGNWVTGLAIGVGAVIVLPLAAPILRPLAKTAIKGGILAYRAGAGLVEGIGDLVAEIAPRMERKLSRRRWRWLRKPQDDAAAAPLMRRAGGSISWRSITRQQKGRRSRVRHPSEARRRFEIPSRATPNAYGGWRTSRVVAPEVSPRSWRLIAAGLENGGHRFR